MYLFEDALIIRFMFKQVNWKKRGLVRFLGFGRGTILLDKGDGQWYSEKNSRIKCNIANAVAPHHDLNCSEFKERIKTVCSVLHGKQHQPKIAPHEAPSRHVLEYLLFRWKARMNQFANPDWKGKKVISRTYKEWPLAMGLNPRRIYTSMAGTLETIAELGRDPSDKDEYDCGKTAEEAFEVVMAILLQDQPYWDPPALGKLVSSFF